MKAIIPEKNIFKSRYYQYIEYIKQILLFNNVEVITKGEVTGRSFYINFNGRIICFDYYDYHDIMDMNPVHLGVPYFKYHWHAEEHKDFENVFPWTGLTFYDWKRFFSLKKKISYKCNSNIILNRQRRPNDRRKKVKDILKDYYKDEVKLDNNVSQIDFWKELNDCLVYVHVPGCRKDSLDRGQKQVMAFGGCVIAPEINDYLAYKKKPLADIHYLKCKYDYSDLIDKIEWCKTHRKQCIEIGQNAKKLFEDTSTPQKLFTWLLKNIGGIK